jgi:uncharacterized membrane-anchored protein
MTQSKKYDFRIEQEDSSWTVDIIRRVTSRTVVVSKSQSGFATEAEAKTWAEDEVSKFLKRHNLNEQQKRRARKIEDEKRVSMKSKPEEELEEKPNEDQED